MENDYVEVSYKEEHEQFVSGNQGSSVLEITFACASCPVSVFMRDAILSWLFGKAKISTWNRFCVDFFAIVLPGLLCTTLFSSDLDSFLTTLLCVGFLLLVISQKISDTTGQTATETADPKQIWDHKVSSHRPFITHFRAFTGIATAVFILAVDFQVYPRRFCKTENYGTGLMDVGVGGFIMANGIVSPEARGKFKVKRGILGKCWQVLQVIKSTLPLWILGIGRLVSVKGTDYHEHITEYGVHWNFFFTLAIVRILATIVLLIFPIYLSWLLATVTAVSYQYVLEEYHLKEFILFGSGNPGENSTRQGFLNANREGIFSCLGYLSIYLASVSIGLFLAKPRSTFSHWLNAFVTLLLLDIGLWVALHYISVEVEPVSRRMGNLGFVVWMMAHQLFFLCSFFLVDIVSIVLRYINILQRPESSSSEFCILEAVNRNGLLYFLLANLLTGAVNFSIETIHAPASTAYVILVGYMFLLSLITAMLHLKDITFRFW